MDCTKDGGYVLMHNAGASNMRINSEAIITTDKALWP